jgi:endonuclease/exonuclease/phosphatase family metal-dependent hydrolase
MKNRIVTERLLFIGLLILLLILSRSCEMPATSFKEVEDAVSVEKSIKSSAPAPDSSIIVMSWNIRYGMGRGPWFGDACGYQVIYSRDTIIRNIQLIVSRINEVQPDILILQEAELNSSRSAYVDEVSWILNNTYFNYAAYGYQWKAQFVPSDGLGRINEANVIFSRWPLKDSKRIQLELRNDLGALERYFYERFCMVESVAEIPGFKDLSVINIHAVAFATDDTKYKHLVKFKDEIDLINQNGGYFVAGGDLNTIPPGSIKTDYCIEDMCSGESFHQPGDNPQHKEGSNYAPETEWLVPIYDQYSNIIPLSVYSADEEKYFTHTTRPGHFWDRTLDYIFTNSRWRDGASFVRQDFLTESDHAPVGGELILIK